MAPGTGELAAIVLTEDETSVVGPERRMPADACAELGFRVLCVEGPLDFGLVGVISSLTAVLAEARVSVFVVSTFNTDYILIKERDLSTATTALSAAGHDVDLAPH
jgi:hypothetical protein